MSNFTTLSLINSIKRRASIPTSQSLFTSADLVAIMDEELHSLIVPFILKMRESYLVTSTDIPIVEGTTEYSIPSQAIGMKLKDLVLLDSASEIVGELPLVTKLSPYRGYWVKNNKIVLHPDEKADCTSLRLSYFRRPNTLAETTDCGEIQSINTLTNELTLVSCPSTWTSSTKIDVISATPGFDCLAENVSIVAINGYVVQLASVAGLSVGDWVAPTGYSPIPQVPYEAHLLLAQAATLKVLEALNDQAGLVAASKKYDEMKEAFLIMISPRVDESPKKITSSIW